MNIVAGLIMLMFLIVVFIVMVVYIPFVIGMLIDSTDATSAADRLLTGWAAIILILWIVAIVSKSFPLYVSILADVARMLGG